MKLTELTINGIGGIKSLYVKFRPDMNIICGPNGVGKSTLLLAASFPFLHGYTNRIKRNVTSETGSVSLIIEDNSVNFNSVLDVNVH
ncbi:TPA: AAA family ATPase, partial [Escherichia coli]|nr:AAA family ATPase [Escherichia coli]